MKWIPETFNGINILRSASEVKVAASNSLVQYTMSQAAFREMCALTSNELSPPAVQRILNSTETLYDLTACISRLIGYFPDEPKLIFNDTTARKPRSYKFEYIDEYDFKIKSKGQHFCTPIIDGAFVPASCKSNDLTCIDSRVEKLQQRTFVSPPIYTTYLKEFPEVLARHAPGMLHPFDFSAVLDHASGAQKKKYKNTMFQPTQLKNKAFQKAEAYPEIKDPRNISAVDPKHVFNLLRFVLPYVKSLKTTKWYAFGKHPRVLGKLVLDVMLDNYGVLGEGDFSRYDGTQNGMSVDLTTNAMCALFNPIYHEEIRALKYQLSYCVFLTEHKIAYNTYDTMKSGSAVTSCDNTVFHAFTQYSHYRNEGFPPELAYARIGICAGDDGLMRTANPAGYEKTCSDLGLKLKFCVREPTDPVGFLGRVWPHRNSSKSFFDPMRCLNKFHYSDNSDPHIARQTLAWRKAAGYVTTDFGNFIGHIATDMLSRIREGKTDPVERREWLKGILPENAKMTSLDLLESLETNGAVFETFTSDFTTLRDVEGNLDPCFLHFCRQIKKSPEEMFLWYTSTLNRPHESDPLIYQTIAKTVPVAPKGTTVTVGNVTLGEKTLKKAPVPEPKQAPICRLHFFDKKCKRGTKCKFSHVLEKICTSHLVGKCTRKQCKFVHTTLSAAI